MRVFGGLGALLPTVAGCAILAAFPVLAASTDETGRLLLAAVATGLVGVGLAFGVAMLLTSWRLHGLVRDAERIASGELDVEVHPGGRTPTGRLATALASIGEALRVTHERATVDRLTGVANRQVLLGTLVSEVERAVRYGRPFSVAFVDIDHFKAVNDTYGHAAGDIVLRGVAQAIRMNLRGTDTIGRYGGEEFMLLLTETDPDEAAQLTEKLRALVARLRFPVEGNPALQVTISIGIAGGVGQTLRTDALVRDADAAMYSAKALGRNQTYVFAEPDEDARVPRAPVSPAGRARALEVGRIARDAAVEALAKVIAPLSDHRGRPSARVVTAVTAMAARLHLPETDVERIRIAALLNDIGKIVVPEDVLEKGAPLTSAEWRTVVQHPRIGQLVLEQAASLRDAAPIILHHHERYGGHGYPFGLRGNDIPLGSRILAVADAYDAMTTDRPHRPAMTHEQAIRELARHGGTQFDPEVVGIFCALYADEPPVADPGVEALLGPAPEPVPAPSVAPVEPSPTPWAEERTTFLGVLPPVVDATWTDVAAEVAAAPAFAAPDTAPTRRGPRVRAIPLADPAPVDEVTTAPAKRRRRRSDAAG